MFHRDVTELKKKINKSEDSVTDSLYNYTHQCSLVLPLYTHYRNIRLVHVKRQSSYGLLSNKTTYFQINGATIDTHINSA